MTSGGSERSLRVPVGDVSLHVVVRRPGREDPAAAPVVLLHGFTGSAETMEVAARALSKERATVCVDLVGHGRSDVPEELAPYRMRACLTQLERLCKELALGSPHWLGYSMGGRTALCLAAFHPQCVRSLMLVGASAGLATAAEREARVAADEALADRIEAGPAGTERPAGEWQGLEGFVDHWMALPLFASQARLGDEALAAARRQRLSNDPKGLANSLRGMGTGAQPPVHAFLPELRAPVALLVGDEDAKFLAIAETLSSTLPEARVIRIANAGHAAHLENPDDLAREVCDFVRQIDARRTR